MLFRYLGTTSRRSFVIFKNVTIYVNVPDVTKLRQQFSKILCTQLYILFYLFVCAQPEDSLTWPKAAVECKLE